MCVTGEEKEEKVIPYKIIATIEDDGLGPLGWWSWRKELTKFKFWNFKNFQNKKWCPSIHCQKAGAATSVYAMASEPISCKSFTGRPR